MKQNSRQTTHMCTSGMNNHPKGLGLNKATSKWRSVCIQSACSQCGESSSAHLIMKYSLA